MALRLHCKNSKYFRLPASTEGKHGDRKFLISAGQTVAAPEWVATTDTFKYGLKDGTIVDLTPTTRPVPATQESVLEPEPEGEEEEEQQRPSNPEPHAEPTDEELESANAATRVRGATRLPAGTVRAATRRKG